MFKTLYVMHGNPGRLFGAKSILVIFGEISWGFQKGWECFLPAYLKSQNTHSPCFQDGLDSDTKDTCNGSCHY